MREGVSINPSTAVVVPFSERRKYSLHMLFLKGDQLVYSTEIKFLGVVLDQNQQLPGILDIPKAV